jgi:hypothetical protein
LTRSMLGTQAVVKNIRGAASLGDHCEIIGSG